jgi:hypothetical protein
VYGHALQSPGVIEMKQPMTLMQEIEDILGSDPEFLAKPLNRIILRRSQPFTPEILADYGFQLKEDKYGYPVYENGDIKLDFVINGCASFNDRFELPIWKTIDEFENDLSRVLEALK